MQAIFVFNFNTAFFARIICQLISMIFFWGSTDFYSRGGIYYSLRTRRYADDIFPFHRVVTVCEGSPIFPCDTKRVFLPFPYGSRLSITIAQEKWGLQSSKCKLRALLLATVTKIMHKGIFLQAGSTYDPSAFDRFRCIDSFDSKYLSFCYSD